jgi:two-component system cell cycle response regulator
VGFDLVLCIITKYKYAETGRRYRFVSEVFLSARMNAFQQEPVFPSGEDLHQETQRLLVVDDDPAILKFLCEFFDRLGYQYRTACDGVAALALLEQASSTIVVTDLLMPKMDGMELIRRVKLRWPDTDLMVMTGDVRNFSYIDVIRAGASDFIQKPFNLDELEAKFNRIIRERGLRALLKRLSVRDPLTDLYNRRFFEQRLEEETERASRQSYFLFLVVLDLDGFKALNDNRGHQAGDDVLRRLADVMRRSTRSFVDTAFRCGGDEFAVIIPQAGVEQAGQIAERIRQNFLEEDVGGTTLSLGVSCFVRTGARLRDDINRLVREADAAMYAAKRAGGNRVVMKEPPAP